MDSEYESMPINQEDIADFERSSLLNVTSIMTKYYDAIRSGAITEKQAEEKDIEVAKFIGSLSAQNIDFNPSEYRLYYVLTNQEPDAGVEYKFDIPGPGRLSKGVIEQFIEKTFKFKK